ncbi:MAG: gamma-glutamylcyclotransferase family protein [Planctomycetota bacterium]
MVTPTVFTYGTLMISDVMRAVTGQTFSSQPATLNGYARFRVKGEVYPGIVAATDTHIDGRLYMDVDDTSLGRLDRFEGEIYARQMVKVISGDGKPRLAVVYVIRDVYRDCLSGEPWDEKDFIQQHLPAFLRSADGLISDCE